MPEGHTLHRLAGELNEAFAGQLIQSTSPQGRFEAGARVVDGHRFIEAWARGKHVFVRFDGTADQVHVHLGLFGGWTVEPGETPVRGQVRWRLATADRVADLRGPTACELLTPPQVDTLVARLGPDPLVADEDPTPAWERIARSRVSIAALLMDQSVVSGVGNVYRAEVLFRHGIDPMTPGRDITRVEWDAMWADLVILMAQGVRSGRIDTVRPEHEPEAMGRPARRDDHGGEVYVYRRDGQPCLICGTSVRTSVVASRNLFWCPNCQQDR